MHSVWVSVYSIQAQLPALEAKPETNKYRLLRCACGLRGCPGTLAPASDVHPAPTPCRLGTTKALTGTGPVLCLLQPLLFSVQGPALPLAGRWEGWMGARVQVSGCSLGSLFEDRGAGRQAPRASRLYAPLYAFAVLQWTRPTPTAVLPLPCPPGPLEGALRSHTSFRPCP